MTTRFAPRQALWLFAILALGAPSAFSQSSDYRRGYDQGYRDGMAAAQGGQDQPAERRERILIDEAQYGTRGATCDASEAIRQIAGRRRHAEFKVDNALCGDPAKNRIKRLVVRYRCGDGPEQRAEAREGGVMSLYCR